MGKTKFRAIFACILGFICLAAATVAITMTGRAAAGTATAALVERIAVNAGETEHDAAFGAGSFTTHTHSQGTPFTQADYGAGGALAGGDYYLTEDVELTAGLTVASGTVNLCLNGHVLSIAPKDAYGFTDKVFNVTGGELNLFDDEWTESDDVKHYYTKYAGQLSDQYSTTYNIENLYKFHATATDASGYVLGGIVTGACASSNGGAVYATSGVFRLYGGALAGNMNASPLSIHGSALYAEGEAVCRIAGGLICGNWCEYGAVRVSSLELYSGVITDNQSAWQSNIRASSITVQGTPDVSGNHNGNGYPPDMLYGGTIKITGPLYRDTPNGRIYARLPLGFSGDPEGTVITSGYGQYNDSIDPAEIFSISGYGVGYTDDGQELKINITNGWTRGYSIGSWYYNYAAPLPPETLPQSKYGTPQVARYVDADCSIEYTDEFTALTPAGTYYVKYWVDGTDEYAAITGVFTVEVGKGTYYIGNLQFSDATVEYDGQTHSLAATNLPTGMDGVTVTVTYENNDKIDAGEHTVTAKFTSSPNYNDIADMTATLTITQATNAWTTEPSEISDVIYGETPTVSKGEARFGTVKVEYKLKTGGDDTYTELQPVDAGEYTARFSVAETGNYTGLAVEKNFTISRKAIAVTIDDKTSVYGAAEAQLTAKLKNGSTLAYTDTYADLKIVLTRGKGDTVGEYNITGVCNNGNYNVTFEDGKYTIGKATYDMSGVTFTGKTVTYTGGKYSLAVAGALPDGVTVTYDKATSYTDAGTYTVTAKFAGDATNYNAIADKTATLTIEQAIVAAPTIDDRVYTGGVVKAVVPASELYTVTKNDGGTAQGTYNVELTLNDYANYKWAEGSTVGGANDEIVTVKFRIVGAQNAWSTTPTVGDVTYGTAITTAGAAKYGDVVVSYATADGQALTEAPTAAGSYKATFTVAGTDEYTSLTAEVTFVISPKAITVTIDDKTSVYGETAVSLTCALNENELAYSDTQDGLGITLTKADGTNAGKYAITGDWTNKNYEVEFTGGTYEITPKEVTVSGITAADKVYDGTTAATVNCAGATLTGLVGNDKLTVTASGAFADKHVGAAKTVTLTGLTLGGADAGNYVLASGSQTTATAAVTAREISITLEDKTSVYGAADAKLTSTITAGTVIAGDDLGLTLQRETGKDVDAYAITGDWTNKDYAVMFAEGEYTITAKEVTVSGITAVGRTYDGSILAELDYASVIIDGVVAGDGLSVKATGVFADKNAGTNKTVTLSGLTLTGASAKNYVLASAGQQKTTTANITAKEVTVSGITAADKVYDGTADAAVNCNNAVITGVLAGETVTVTASGAFADKNVGADKTVTLTGLTLGGADAGNYVLASDSQTTATAAVTAREISITLEDKTSVYGEALQELTYKVTDGEIVNGDTLNIAITKAAGETVNEYAITGAYNNGNYTVTITSGTYTITKATYDMTGVAFEGLKVTYNGQAHSVEVTGLPAGVSVAYDKATSYTNAGEYVITATFTASDTTNYNALSVTTLTAALTIDKAVYDMSGVRFSDATVTYNGAAQSVEATNLPTGVTVTYEGNGQTQAGTYTVTATFTGDANHEAIEAMEVTLTIEKAVYDMSVIAFDSITVTYDGASHSLAIAGTLPAGVTVTYENNGKTEVGTYTVIAKFAGDAENYEAIGNKTATLTINAQAVEPEPEKGGCGCIVPDGVTIGGIALAALVVGVILIVRRKRSK